MTISPKTIDQLPEGSVNFTDFHRWLNPFATARATMIVDMCTDEIDETIGPQLFSITRSPLPYEGLYGSLTPSGFRVTHSLFQQPALSVDYVARGDQTQLNLTLKRSTRGVLGWFWNMLVMPVVAILLLIGMWSDGIIGPPDWINTGALWVSGNALTMQPLWYLCAAIAMASFLVSTILSSYQQRHDMALYIRELEDTFATYNVELPQ